LIGHNNARTDKYFELLQAGRTEEAEKVKSELPAVREREASRQLVERINHLTISSADRFVFSPFESPEIAQKLEGESQNMRIKVSPPPAVRPK
jgi:hypothetical protein